MFFYVFEVFLFFLFLKSFTSFTCFFFDFEFSCLFFLEGVWWGCGFFLGGFWLLFFVCVCVSMFFFFFEKMIFLSDFFWVGGVWIFVFLWGFCFVLFLCVFFCIMF